MADVCVGCEGKRGAPFWGDIGAEEAAKCLLEGI